MRLALMVATGVLSIATSGHAADTRSVLAIARQHIETEDARATGHLVRVDAAGNRSSDPFTIKAHWFPGVLRVLLEITPSQTPASEAHPETATDLRSKAHPGVAPPAGRVSILLEMRPGGQSTIRIYQPHEAAPASLPFDRWGESIVGSNFNYEDFLEPESYWENQTFLKTATVSAHVCDVLKSTPGASNRSHYAEVQTWFDQASGYPMHAEKTLKDAATVKEFTSLGLRQSGGVWSARQVEVKIHGRPGSTLLIFERGSTRANLTLKDFSPEQINKAEKHP